MRSQDLDFVFQRSWGHWGNLGRCGPDSWRSDGCFRHAGSPSMLHVGLRSRWLELLDETVTLQRGPTLQLGFRLALLDHSQPGNAVAHFGCGGGVASLDGHFVRLQREMEHRNEPLLFLGRSESLLGSSSLLPQRWGFRRLTCKLFRDGSLHHEPDRTVHIHRRGVLWLGLQFHVKNQTFTADTARASASFQLDISWYLHLDIILMLKLTKSWATWRTPLGFLAKWPVAVLKTAWIKGHVYAFANIHWSYLHVVGLWLAQTYCTFTYIQWSFCQTTVGYCRFCARLGFGNDIDTAEEKRARRLGKKRATDLQVVSESHYCPGQLKVCIFIFLSQRHFYHLINIDTSARAFMKQLPHISFFLGPVACLACFFSKDCQI